MQKMGACESFHFLVWFIFSWVSAFCIWVIFNFKFWVGKKERLLIKEIMFIGILCLSSCICIMVNSSKHGFLIFEYLDYRSWMLGLYKDSQWHHIDLLGISGIILVENSRAHVCNGSWQSTRQGLFPPFFLFFNEKFQHDKVTLIDVICLVKLLYGSERKEYW